MDVLYNMKRCEKKYFITETQYGHLLPLLREHMRPDPYGNCEVSSLYYDTDDFSVIRSCLDFPQYKEKFRLRTYGSSTKQNALVFAELKKKFNGWTSKCRVALPLNRVPDFFSGSFSPEGNEQTVREIRWFMNHFHNPSPKVLMRCSREPWEGITDQNLRITMDRAIRWRTGPFSSMNQGLETPLLVPAEIVMEIKMPDAVPLWLCSFLSEEGIYCTSFSKYGTWYKTEITANA